MGEVLLARRRGPSGFERLVALKTIRAELRGQDPLRRMFLDEAQLLARLSHPAIAQIFDFGEDDGVLFLAMEYVAGVSFRDLVGQRPPPAVSARAMAEVCRALHAAHELTDLAGNSLVVVHRDVSPDNLMLAFDGQVKVLDFGIALMRGRQAPVTEYGTIKGKPPYLSPEQIKNLPVDRRTDVFAASAVLHELLTGVQVFDGDSVYAIARSIELDEVAPPSVTAGPLPPGLDDAVMRGLERDPDRRWQTTDELARALDQVVAGVGGETLAEYAARQLGDEHRRHREWLRVVIEERSTGRPRTGRASGILTARAAVFDPDAPTLDGTMPGRGRRRLLVALLGAAVVAAAAGALGLREPARPPGSPGADPGASARAGAPDAQLPGGATANAADARLREGATPDAPDARSPGGATPDAPAAPTRAGVPGSEADAPEGIAAAPAGSDGPVDRADRPTTGPVDRADRPTTPPPAPAAGSKGGRARALADGDPPRDAKARRKKPRAAADRRPGRSPASPRGAETAATPPASEVAEPEGTGSITLRTQAGSPWAKVRIDGKDAGSTPIKQEIRAGSHQIEFVRPDNDEVRYRRSVHVHPGKHVEVVAP
jgi:serine/threonine-protein kinase